MRKIENRDDWNDFIDDCREYTSDRKPSYFGLSQTGEGIACVFSTQNIAAELCGFCIYKENDGKPRDFIEKIEDSYVYPFYICEVGDDYPWL